MSRPSVTGILTFGERFMALSSMVELPHWKQKKSKRSGLFFSACE
jgi:hypothetical protein